MPNWCSNTVIVDGEKREIARFEQYVMGDTEPFSFQSILPMPEELQGTVSPTRIVTQEEYDNYEPPSHGFDVGKPITKEMSDRFKEQYDADNWCDWANENWGTKWDVVDGGGIEAGLAPTHLNYSFDTAWGPPNGIYEELVNQFPTLTINWHYSEPHMRVSGNLATDKPRNRQSVREVNKRIAKILSSLSTKTTG
jgi:hypothetical protein